MATTFELFFEHAFLQRALLAALVVALLCGILGVFIVLRGLSMLGDGLAHVSFAGVALGLVLGIYPLALALVLAVVGALVIHALRTSGVVKGDTAIGILFTAGLSIGVILVSARGGPGFDVQAYLFGSLLAVTERDLAFLAIVGAVLVLALVAFFKEFFAMTLSEEAARLSGIPVALLNVVFMALTAATIVMAARVVGILLVSSLIVVPAASSLQLASSFRRVVALSIAFALASAVIGVYAAAEYGLAAGGTIAFASTVLFAASLAARGAIARFGRRAGAP